MKYLLFEKSAINTIIGRSEFQSVEYPQGQNLIDFIRGKADELLDNNICIIKNNKGIIFSGKEISFDIIVFDLEQCEIIDNVKEDELLLSAIQKILRNAIKTWNRYPFSSSEIVHGTKTIIFPFLYPDKRRIVIERAARNERLIRRGIKQPLLVYNCTEQGSDRDEQLNLDNLREAGETYLKSKSLIRKHFESLTVNYSESSANKEKPMIYTAANETVSGGDFIYLGFEDRLKRLTTTQKNVVTNDNVYSPIRIEGAAGTGKTASMILRAFYLLEKMRNENKPFKIIFLSHSESTNIENRNAFSYIGGSDKYLTGEIPQKIEFLTLLKYCVQTIRISDSQVIDINAIDAKDMQRIYIEEAFDETMRKKHKTFRALLSDKLQKLLDEKITPKGVLLSLLQHEFSVQIKGRTNCTIEEYYQLDSIENAMILETNKDKEFIFEIFKKYQEMLSNAAIYDLDDITIETIQTLNAPIWRRERKESGYDYIFVDEMHLFNINEQYCFHYLTKSVEQKDIPICFALDYSQAIGDRGDVQQDYIERNFKNADENNFNTVFRSSQQITNFCAAISAAGALMFQSSYKNPYNTATSGFTLEEENNCGMPKMYFYGDDDRMFKAISGHFNDCKRKFSCKNKDIALISFVQTIFEKDRIVELSESLNHKIKVINSRHSSISTIDANDSEVLLFDPISINGLEFKCVILIGVDDGRVPQNSGVNDISENYLKFVAFNQLYLASSRAKYNLIILGNKLHGESSCLKYAVSNNLLEVINN